MRRLVLLFTLIGFVWVVVNGVNFLVWLATAIFSFVAANFVSLVAFLVVAFVAARMLRRSQRRQENLTLEEWMLRVGEEQR